MSTRTRYHFKGKPTGRAPATVVGAVNFKGGCGKTTSTSVFATLAASKGEQILLVDMDHQVNLTQVLGLDSDPATHIGHALHNVYGDWDTDQFHAHILGVKQPGIGVRMDVLPGNNRFHHVVGLMEKIRGVDESVPHRLRDGIDKIKPFYDFIFIDTPPNVDELPSTLVIHAVDVLIIPVDGTKAAAGAIGLLEKVRATYHERELQGRAPLQVFLYCPDFHMDRTANPYGPEQVRNDTWYPLLHGAFPDHFITPVVKHSIGMKRSTDGNILRTLSHDNRVQYKAQFNAIRAAIKDPTRAPLSVNLRTRRDDLNHLRNALQDLIAKERNQLIVKPVRFEFPDLQEVPSLQATG